MTFTNVLAVIAILGGISIIWRRIKVHGIIVGTVYGLLALIPWGICCVIFGALVGGYFQAADKFNDGPEKRKEQWRQEQIATTGDDPCANTFAMERQRRERQELIDSGQIDNGDMLTNQLNNDPYAALDHDLEMAQNSPSLDYVESAGTE
ncbi:hypothetical protein NQ042_10500 [Corynebacterium phoceense]|uniref:hypothetical protein n=1 Tax=Corynebacterium phoceense TaxID=1686286 RepID=UPI00211BE80C|nr:hypothetical protein [Corynebacterium phoceense]MCQ9334494.1 hypothetical protein [Corynebacterium phoceense]